jgi:tetratricopeptide (TPR) repeat protein
MHFFILFIILLIGGCASQRNTLQQNFQPDAFSAISHIVQIPAPKIQQLSPQQVHRLTVVFDSLCAEKVDVAPDKNLTRLQKNMESMAALDTALSHHYAAGENNRLATASRELNFRLLVATQNRLKESFQNDSAGAGEKYMDSDGRTVYVFKQQVSQLLPYIQANEKFSRMKSTTLLKTINSLKSMDNADDRKRCWMAIGRMIEEVDLVKSAYNYAPFQRTAKGLFLNPDSITLPLRQAFNNESNAAVKEISAQVIQSLDDKLQTPADKKFLQEIEASKERENLYVPYRPKKTGSISENSTLSKSPQERAREWIELASESENQVLKIEYCSKAIELVPDHAPYYFQRGNCYKDLKDFDAAIKDYSKAIQIDDQFIPSYQNRGQLLQFEGRHLEALEDFNKVLAHKPGNAHAHFRCAFSLQRLNRTSESLEEYSKAISLDSSQAAYFVNRSNLYRETGQNQKALNDLNRALALEPDNVAALNDRGICYRKLLMYQKAINDHNRAIELSPQSSSGYYNLGCAYWELKDWPAVIQAWQKCLAIDPQHKEAREWLPKVKKAAGIRVK